MASYTTDRTLWLTADRDRVVEDGDPEAAFLLARRGQEVPAALVKRYGLGSVGKQVSGPPADKSRHAPTGNKARS